MYTWKLNNSIWHLNEPFFSIVYPGILIRHLENRVWPSIYVYIRYLENRSWPSISEYIRYLENQVWPSIYVYIKYLENRIWPSIYVFTRYLENRVWPSIYVYIRYLENRVWPSISVYIRYLRIGFDQVYPGIFTTQSLVSEWNPTAVCTAQILQVTAQQVNKIQQTISFYGLPLYTD